MNIYCDDGSTNVKLAWFEGDELQTRVSANSFRHGWKVAEFSAATFNYQVGTLKYTWDSVSRDAIPTTNVEYQYGDLNLLAVHHALLNSGLEPQRNGREGDAGITAGGVLPSRGAEARPR